MPSSTSFAEVLPPPFVEIGVVAQYEPRTTWLTLDYGRKRFYLSVAPDGSLSENRTRLEGRYALVREGRVISLTPPDIEVGDTLIRFKYLSRLQLPTLPKAIHHDRPSGWEHAIRTGRIQPRWR